MPPPREIELKLDVPVHNLPRLTDSSVLKGASKSAAKPSASPQPQGLRGRAQAVQGSELTGALRPYGSAHFDPGFAMDTNCSD